MLRPRLRTFTLWTGTLLSLLIAAAFVVSAWWFVVVQVPTPYGPFVSLVHGAIVVMMDDFPYDWVHVETKPAWDLFRWNRWGATAWGVELPLYAVFAAIAIPTLLVWRFWPKPSKPGHCRCGYDLRGNESGVCPECGVEVPA